MLLDTLFEKKEKDIFPDFMAFSEYLNFIHFHFLETVSMLTILKVKIFRKNSNATLYRF